MTTVIAKETSRRFQGQETRCFLEVFAVVVVEVSTQKCHELSSLSPLHVAGKMVGWLLEPVLEPNDHRPMFQEHSYIFFEAHIFTYTMLVLLHVSSIVIFTNST